MPRPTASQRKALRAAAVPVALLASGALVWQGSYAAFTAETNSGSNAWTTGVVSLSNDLTGQAVFSELKIRPGASGSKCVTVTNTSDYEGTVKFWATVSPGGNNGANLANALQVTVERGASCTAFTAVGTPYATGAMSGLPTSGAPAADTWAATAVGGASASQAYRISWNLPGTTTESAADASVDTVFTWKLEVPNAV
ncbi:MAG: hypothetical protein R2737_00660 [Candidatus Nanopelagicales bacterium]